MDSLVPAEVVVNGVNTCGSAVVVTPRVNCGVGVTTFDVVTLITGVESLSRTIIQGELCLGRSVVLATV